jgi:hypothetical protein
VSAQGRQLRRSLWKGAARPPAPFIECTPSAPPVDVLADTRFRGLAVVQPPYEARGAGLRGAVVRKLQGVPALALVPSACSCRLRRPARRSAPSRPWPTRVTLLFCQRRIFGQLRNCEPLFPYEHPQAEKPPSLVSFSDFERTTAPYIFTLLTGPLKVKRAP